MKTDENITSAAFRVREAAVYLAVSQRTVWTLIKGNKIPAVRFGKTTRILRTDLDNFIEQCRGQR